MSNETRETTEAGPSTSSQATSFSVIAQSEAASSPPPRRSAMAELFSLLFKIEQSNQPDQRKQLKNEVFTYMAKDYISVDCNPISWWKACDFLYPKLSHVGKELPGCTCHLCRQTCPHYRQCRQTYFSEEKLENRINF